MLRLGEDLAEDPGKAVTRRVTLWKSRAAFPGKLFTFSKHFVFSCKGRIWENMMCIYGRCRCRWNHQGAGWEVCAPKYYTLPWGLPKKQNAGLKMVSETYEELSSTAEALHSREDHVALPKPREPVWVNQEPHTQFVISLYRLRNPARRIRVGCIPKQKSINILVKTLQWSGSGKICIKISKQTLLPNSSV